MLLLYLGDFFLSKNILVTKILVYVTISLPICCGFKGFLPNLIIWSIYEDSCLKNLVALDSRDKVHCPLGLWCPQVNFLPPTPFLPKYMSLNLVSLTDSTTIGTEFLAV